MAFTKQGPKLYFGELLGAMALYYGAMVWRHSYGLAHHENGPLKTVMMLLPMLPAILAALAILRFYQRMDEMQQRATLETVALAAAFGALTSLALGFAQDAGAPHIGIIWAWPLMGIGWLIVAAWRNLPRATEAVGWRNVLWIGGKMAAVVLLPTLAYALIAAHLGWPHGTFLLVRIATLIFFVQYGWYLFVKRIHG
jgi:hypothetical protein